MLDHATALAAFGTAIAAKATTAAIRAYLRREEPPPAYDGQVPVEQVVESLTGDHDNIAAVMDAMAATHRATRLAENTANEALLEAQAKQSAATEQASCMLGSPPCCPTMRW